MSYLKRWRGSIVTYKEWFISHGKKHQEIVKRLSHLSDDEIIEYFRFENMQKNEPDFCPLYAKDKKCHDMDNLNCYLCACPYFRFSDDGISKRGEKVIKSICSIDAKDSSEIEHNDIIHLNCSFCTLPHRESFIKRVFNRDWFKIMKSCQI